MWFIRAPNVKPLVKTNIYECGSYLYFDPVTWENARKDNFVVQYEMLEKQAKSQIWNETWLSRFFLRP